MREPPQFESTATERQDVPNDTRETVIQILGSDTQSQIQNPELRGNDLNMKKLDTFSGQEKTLESSEHDINDGVDKHGQDYESLQSLPRRSVQEKKSESAHDDREKLEAEEPMCNTVDDGQNEFIYLGQKFSSQCEFDKALEDFKTSTHSVLTTRSSKKNQSTDEECKKKFKFAMLLLYCTHGMKARKRGKNVRQHSYNDRGCPFQLLVKLQKDNLVVVKFDNVHDNHELSKESSECHPQNRILNDSEQQKYIPLLVDLEASKIKVKELITEETGKKTTSRDLINAVAKIRSANVQQGDVMNTLTLLQKQLDNDPGATGQVRYDESDDDSKTISILFYQSSEMKKLLQQYGSILLIDGTYNLCVSGFVCVTFIVIDNNMKGRLVGWAFVSQEDKDTFGEVLDILKNANEPCIKDLKFIMIDKDFAEINAIHDVLPWVHFIICRFHSIKAVNRYIHNLVLDREHQYLKRKLKTFFERLLYAPSEDLYLECWKELCQLATINETMDSAVKYFNNNWHVIRQHWARYCLKDKKILSTFTNNRSENFNHQLKNQLQQKSTMEKVISVLLSMEKQQTRDKFLKDWKSSNKTLSPFHVGDLKKDELMKKTENFMTTESRKKVLEEYDRIFLLDEESLNMSVGQVVCTRNQGGPCTFHASYGLPCSHLLFTRISNDESVITRDMVDKRWFKSQDQDSNDQSLATQEGPILTKRARKTDTTDKKRYLESGPVLKEINRILSQCPDGDREKKLEVLSKIKDCMNRDDFIKVVDNTLITNEKKGAENKRSSKENVDIIKFDPKKVNKLTKNQGSTKLPPSKKLKKIDKNLDPWMRKSNESLKRLGAKAMLDNADFQILLDPSLRGTAAFLSDRHIDAASTLLHQQFPTLQGLQHSSLYKVYGFEAIDPQKDFLQICHAGYEHWVVLTNIGIPQNERSHKIRLYDSLIQLSPGYSDRCVERSAIDWQVCQIMRNQSSPECLKKNITMEIMPCQQQNNCFDCGIFAIANAFTLAHLGNPSEIVYTGEMRKEFAEMIKVQKVLAFEFLPKKGTFITPAQLGSISTNVTIPQMTQSLVRICDCHMPASWDNVIICEKCQREYHQKCYLIGSSVIAQKIDFVCYSCRIPNDYSFITSKSNEGICNQSIDEFVASLKHMPSYRLQSILSDVLTLDYGTRQIPQNLMQFKDVEKIIIRYDLNAVGKESGNLFAAIHSYYANNVQNTSFKQRFHEFFTLNLAQRIHLAILLIVFEEGLNCPFLTRKIGNKYQDLVTLGREDANKMRKQIKDLEKLAEMSWKILSKLQANPCGTYVASLDDHSSFKTNIDYLTKEIEELNSSLSNFQLDDIGMAKIQDELIQSTQCLNEKLLDMKKTHDRIIDAQNLN